MRRSPTALLAALLLPLAPAPAQAAPACEGGGRVELVGGGDRLMIAGQEHVQGYVLRRRLGGGRSCVVPGATVQLLARTANSSAVTVARTGTTDAEGRVEFRVRPPYTVVLTGRAPTADSAPAVLTVATRLTLGRRTVDACRVAVSGSTYPAKPGTPVDVSRERSRYDHVRVGRFVVRDDGRWSGTVSVPCGADPRLSATIQATARNAFGSSDRRVVVATRTQECGSAPTSRGEVGTALTHSFEPFNTTTAVGGAWWGERVVSNRTDRVLRFDEYSTDTYRLLRRGSTVVIGQNSTSDAIGITPRELAPGEELRTRVALVAGNCLEQPPPDVVPFGLGPGPAFPAGTSLVGVTVLPVDRGESVSGRIALTVT